MLGVMCKSDERMKTALWRGMLRAKKYAENSVSETDREALKEIEEWQKLDFQGFAEK